MSLIPSATKAHQARLVIWFDADPQLCCAHIKAELVAMDNDVEMKRAREDVSSIGSQEESQVGMGTEATWQSVATSCLWVIAATSPLRLLHVRQWASIVLITKYDVKLSSHVECLCNMLCCGCRMVQANQTVPLMM